MAFLLFRHPSILWTPSCDFSWNVRLKKETREIRNGMNSPKSYLRNGSIYLITKKNTMRKYTIFAWERKTTFLRNTKNYLEKRSLSLPMQDLLKRDMDNIQRNTKTLHQFKSTKWSKMIGKIWVKRKRENIKTNIRKKKMISASILTTLRG